MKTYLGAIAAIVLGLVAPSAAQSLSPGFSSGTPVAYNGTAFGGGSGPDLVHAGPQGLIVSSVDSWGRLEADAELFDLALTKASGHFDVSVQASKASGFSVMQLELRLVRKSCARATAADWRRAGERRLVAAGAATVFEQVRGGRNACIGIAATPRADQGSGTHIQLAPGAATRAPTFTASISPHSP